MRQKNKKLGILICSVMLSLPALSSIAAGAESTTVHAEIWRWRINVNEIFAGFHNEQGRTMEAISYNDTIYIPIRNAAEWMGCEIVWDQVAQAIHLTSGGERVILADKETLRYTDEELLRFQDQTNHGVNFVIRPDIAIYLDDKVQTFHTVHGDTVYPAMLDNVTYLPVRNVGEMCGMGVIWLPRLTEEGGRVYLFDPLTTEQKTETLSYESRITSPFNKLEAAIAEYTAADDMAVDVALDKLNIMKGYANEMAQVPPPSVHFLDGKSSSIALHAQELHERGAIAFDIRLLESGNPFAYVKQLSMFQDHMITLGGEVIDMQRLVRALSLENPS